jgi:hypothetical protein
MIRANGIDAAGHRQVNADHDGHEQQYVKQFTRRRIGLEDNRM